MVRQTRTVADIDTAIGELKRKRAAAVDARANDIARIAKRAGLADLNVSDVELLEAFETVAARFYRSTEVPKTETY